MSSKYHEKQLVSPIKIKNSMIMRGSSSNKLKQSQHEYNCSTPKSSGSSTPNRFNLRTRSSSARRNLNESLDSDILNYSIVTPKTDMKIKLRKSQRNIARKLDESQINDLIDNIQEVNIGNDVKSRRKRLHNIDIESDFDDNNSNLELSPTKRNKQTSINEISTTTETPRLRRKSILKTVKTRQDLNYETPKKRVQLSQINEKENETIENSHRRTTRRKSSLRLPSYYDDDDVSISNADVMASIKSLPCREDEFQNIYKFLKNKIQDETGGCMYISGVPGTGKTATVTAVINNLKYESKLRILPEFDFIEINGMKLTEPRQAYVQIYKQLCKENDMKTSISWGTALSVLEKKFTTNKNATTPKRSTPLSHKKQSSQKVTILLVDELDMLCNRRQDVIYTLLDWPTKLQAKLIVITIANTMDLPERVFMGKITSRLGLTRLTFTPYTHQQLQEIVTVKLMKSESYISDAIQLIARKVAAVSGDARRALDICKRAIEICHKANIENNNNKTVKGEKNQPETVNISHVQQALTEMISTVKIQALKNCSRLEKIFLQAIVAEVTRTGIEETLFYNVYTQMESILLFMGLNVPPPGKLMKLCLKLSAERLILCEHSRKDLHQKIILNVSQDDIHYATKVNSN